MMFGACFLSGQRVLFEGVTEKIFLTVKIFPEEIEVHMSTITICTEIMNFATHSWSLYTVISDGTSLV